MDNRPIYLSIYLPIYLSICLSIYLSSSKAQQRELALKQKEEEDRLVEEQRRQQLEMEAREREVRIHRDIVRSRQETTSMLIKGSAAAASSSSSCVSMMMDGDKDKDKEAGQLNSFFQARSNLSAVKSTTSNSNSNSHLLDGHCEMVCIDTTSAVGWSSSDSNSIVGLDGGFPTIQHIGLNEPLQQLLLMHQSSSRGNYSSCSGHVVLRRAMPYTSYLPSRDLNCGSRYHSLITIISDDEQSESGMYIPSQPMFHAIDRSSLDYSCSSSSRRGRHACGYYPWAQASMNLRSTWLSWIASHLKDISCVDDSSSSRQTMMMMMRQRLLMGCTSSMSEANTGNSAAGDADASSSSLSSSLSLS